MHCILCNVDLVLVSVVVPCVYSNHICILLTNFVNIWFILSLRKFTLFKLNFLLHKIFFSDPVFLYQYFHILMTVLFIPTHFAGGVGFWSQFT